MYAIQLELMLLYFLGFAEYVVSGFTVTMEVPCEIFFCVCLYLVCLRMLCSAWWLAPFLDFLWISRLYL